MKRPLLVWQLLIMLQRVDLIYKEPFIRFIGCNLRIYWCLLNHLPIINFWVATSLKILLQHDTFLTLLGFKFIRETSPSELFDHFSGKQLQHIWTKIHL